MTPTTEAGRGLHRDIVELAEAYHQVGSIRSHADPNDKTGWNVHGIETCEDACCMDALASKEAIAAIEAEARNAALDAVAAKVRALAYPTFVPLSTEEVLAAIEEVRRDVP